MWHRFATLPAVTGVVAAVGLAPVLTANSFFGMFDGPAGADGEPCNNRQVQRALDALRDADGYRYSATCSSSPGRRPVRRAIRDHRRLIDRRLPGRWTAPDAAYPGSKPRSSR